MQQLFSQIRERRERKCDMHTRMINVEDLTGWLRVMAENMENVYPDDLYFSGAAKSYRNVIHVIQMGLFDIKHRSQKQ